MPLHFAGKPTSLKAGDRIYFDSELLLLSIGRHEPGATTNGVCPSIANEHDDKCQLDFVHSDGEFMRVCLLMANAAGLDIQRSLERHRNVWICTVVAAE